MKGLLIASWVLAVLAQGCAHMRSKSADNAAANAETPTQKMDRIQTQQKEMEALMAQLNAKLEGMESRLDAMSERLAPAPHAAASSGAPRKPPLEAVAPVPANAKLPVSSDDGLVADEPIRKFREAMLQFQSRNYPDAVLGFSSFIDQYPDHALAGSAQYYLGASYYNEKEYKLAGREYNRVLTSYDRSPHVSDALRDLADCEDKLQDRESADKHRKLLGSLFPQSPAAATAMTSETFQPPADPAPATDSRPAPAPNSPKDSPQAAQPQSPDAYPAEMPRGMAPVEQKIPLDSAPDTAPAPMQSPVAEPKAEATPN
jgi:tol-pal system protein YbgF